VTVPPVTKIVTSNPRILILRMTLSQYGAAGFSGGVCSLVAVSSFADFLKFLRNALGNALALRPSFFTRIRGR